jgi:hypothetical protein
MMCPSTFRRNKTINTWARSGGEQQQHKKLGRLCYVGPCHHVMARPRFTDGGDVLQIWRVATNILNKQSRTACYEMLHRD